MSNCPDLTRLSGGEVARPLKPGDRRPSGVGLLLGVPAPGGGEGEAGGTGTMAGDNGSSSSASAVSGVGDSAVEACLPSVDRLGRRLLAATVALTAGLKEGRVLPCASLEEFLGLTPVSAALAASAVRMEARARAPRLGRTLPRGPLFDSPFALIAW